MGTESNAFGTDGGQLKVLGCGGWGGGGMGTESSVFGADGGQLKGEGWRV